MKELIKVCSGFSIDEQDCERLVQDSIAWERKDAGHKLYPNGGRSKYSAHTACRPSVGFRLTRIT